MPPTIYIKGKLVAHVNSPKQEILDKHIPLNYIMDWFNARINKTGESMADRIMILESSTGSGKSTVLPPEFFHRFFKETGGKNITCTQPKILTAMQVPYQVLPYHTPEWLEMINQSSRTPLVMGENIGYQTGGAKLQPKRGIVYMTIGVLKEQMKKLSDSDFMNKYSLIVIDEVHIRSIDLDLTLFLLKQFIEKNYENPQCPFVVTTSATFDTLNMTNYMLSSIPAPKRYENIIKISGLTYPIESHFAESDSDNYFNDTAQKVIDIHTQNENDIMDPKDAIEIMNLPVDQVIEIQQFRDILIFVGGTFDATKIANKITKMIDDNNNPSSTNYYEKYPLMVLILTSSDVNSKTKTYYDALNPLHTLVQPPSRRVIIATNIAETGITIASLKYVIDTGYVKSAEYNPNYGIYMLITKPITKSAYTQRKGRVGRLYPGISYAMYTKETFDILLRDSFPDIVKDNIVLIILSIIINTSNIKVTNTIGDYIKSDLFYDIVKTDIDIGKIDLFEFPSTDMISSNINTLYTLGAIYKNMCPTKLGLLINGFRKISIENARMILCAYSMDVPIMDIIIIVCFVSTNFSSKITTKINLYNKFINNFKSKFGYEYIDKMKEIISCEFITCILIFYEFQNKVMEETENVYRKTKSLDTDTQTMYDWCEEYGFDLQSLLNIVQMKEEIINSLIDLKLNPYQNSEKSFDSINFMQTYSYIKKIKQCIYEGYKMNLLIWNNPKKKYVTSNGKLTIDIPKNIFLPNSFIVNIHEITPPKYLIYSSIIYIQDSISSRYTPNISYISVLDGYVNFNKSFEKNIFIDI